MHKTFQYILTLLLSLTIVMVACNAYSAQSFNSNIENTKEKNDCDRNDDLSQIKEFFHKGEECLVLFNSIQLTTISFHYKYNTFPKYYPHPPIKPPIFSV